jgi:hypothetical protein
MKNIERIRTMSDDELLRFIEWVYTTKMGDMEPRSFEDAFTTASCKACPLYGDQCKALGECTSDTTIEDDIKTWLYSEEVKR